MDQHENLPAVAHDGTGSAMSLVMDDGAMESMMTAAKLMASARVTIPKHLQNSTGDCLAVIMQAAQWKMNPFAVAQKTHLTQGGTLGYEAQLVNAVIVSCGAIVGQPEFEFFGDWSKILGKVAEKTSEKSGGKYYVSTWDRSAEAGLGVKCIARLKGESEPREIEVLLAQAWPRFSTQWATDPQQQITYLAVRKFARRYAPGAILGVYTDEEMSADDVGEKEINPMPAPARRQTGKQAAEAAKQQADAEVDADARAELVAKLQKIAEEEGEVAYADAFADLGKEGRLTVGADEHKRLKAIAAETTRAMRELDAKLVAEDAQEGGDDE
jgi:hypothetical protein